jgi:hypothetical protein
MHFESLIPPLPRHAAGWLRFAGAACVLGFLAIGAARLFLPGGSSAAGPAKAGAFGEASARVKPYDPLDPRW